jgi:hypothetical protein
MHIHEGLMYRIPILPIAAVSLTAFTQLATAAAVRCGYALGR